MKQLLFYNGKFVNEEDARISLMTHGLNYGTGCFEGIRAYYNKKADTQYIFRLKDHYTRLKNSSKLLFIDIPYTVEELCEITEILIQKNFTTQDLYIRPLAFKSSLTVSNFNLRELENSFAIYSVPLGRTLPAEKGIKANTSSWRRVSDNAIPPRGKITGTYANTSLAKTESLIYGFDEALFLDENGHVVEGSAENIFVIKDGSIITPSVSEDILVGITRDTIITLCEKDYGITIKERSIDRSELYQADELFLVGTGAEVSSVREVDGHQIGSGNIGEITEKIRTLYNEVIRGENSSYASWLTPVKKP